MLGPGLTTGASDDDPSGIATYSQAGSQFGLTTLWTAFLTIPLMINVFEMTGRIALATSKGLMTNFKEHYPKGLEYFIFLCCFPAFTFNVGANLSAMAAVSHLLLPAIPPLIFSTVYAILLGMAMIGLSYPQIVAWLKWSMLILLAYFIVPFTQSQDWKEIVYATFIPQIKWTKEYVLMLVAIIGTTISPYLYFWSGISTAEQKNHQHGKYTLSEQLKIMRLDVSMGMVISNLIMYFIILTTGTVLYKNGITEILSVEQAAQALKPLAGNYAYFLFAMGIIGAGIISIPVLIVQLGYMFCRVFNWPSGLDKKLLQAKAFYGTILGSFFLAWLTNLMQMNPIQMLIYTAVIYGCICPLLQGMILHLANNKKVMGKHRNGWLANTIGFISMALMAGSAISFAYLWLI